MTIKLVENENEGILLIEGRLDTTTSTEAEGIFEEVAEKFTNVTLDIGELQYISSAGLRLILKMYITLNKKGGVLSVKNASPMVMEVFEMVGYTTFCRFI